MPETLKEVSWRYGRHSLARLGAQLLSNARYDNASNLYIYMPRRLKPLGIGTPSGSPATERQSQPDTFAWAYRAAEDAIHYLAQHTVG